MASPNSGVPNLFSAWEEGHYLHSRGEQKQAQLAGGTVRI